MLVGKEKNMAKIVAISLTGYRPTLTQDGSSMKIENETLVTGVIELILNIDGQTCSAVIKKHA